MHKGVYRLIMTCFFLVFVAMVGYMYMFIFEQSPIRYTNIPFPVIGETVYKPGDTIYFTVGRCATRKGTYLFTSNLVEVYRRGLTSLPSTDVTIDDLGCKNVVSVPTIIPENTVPGVYRKEFTTIVKGRYKVFTIPMHTDSFIIANTPLEAKIFTDNLEHKTIPEAHNIN